MLKFLCHCQQLVMNVECWSKMQLHVGQFLLHNFFIALA